jgi:hypothetical protein
MRSDEYRVCSRELDTYVACWTEQALVLMDCCTADKRFVLSRVGLLHQYVIKLVFVTARFLTRLTTGLSTRPHLLSLFMKTP